MTTGRDYAEENLGNIVSLEHVNVTIPNQATATLFYVLGLGLTRDPYMWVGLDNMWMNVGEQQFHLPTRPAGQVIPGEIGLVVPDLGELQARLKAVQDQLAGTRFDWSVEGDDQVVVTCPWGNRLRCHAPAPRFGTEILGIPYVEFWVRPGAADPIARFYREALGAPGVVSAAGRHQVARVAVGRAQWLDFRETDGEIRPYDGHHIQVYVANFSGPYGWLRSHSLIMEDVDVVAHQFRFKTLVDPENNGEGVFTLEHEVRSLRHPLFARSLVNRNPGQTQATYRRGQDALNPSAPTR